MLTLSWILEIAEFAPNIISSSIEIPGSLEESEDRVKHFMKYDVLQYVLSFLDVIHSCQ